MIKLSLPIKVSGPKKEGPPALVAEYPGCNREILRVAGVPATSSLQCADSCKYTGNCQRERELLK